jgi:hypothetical protein
MNQELLNDYYLERYVLGELPDEEAEKIRRQVSGNPGIEAMLKEIESSNHDILTLYPPLSVKASLITRMNEMQSKPTRFSLRRVLYISSALATFLIFLFLILPVILEKTGTEPFDSRPEQSVVKGVPVIDLSQTQLLIFRKIDDQVEMMTDREQAKAGDLLQLAYVAADESHGMILSIDGRGSVTLHFPAEKGGSTELEQRRESFLPNAIELDDAPDFERFFFVTSGSQIDVENVLKRAESLAKDPEQIPQAKLDLPDDLKQCSILILKGEGR